MEKKKQSEFIFVLLILISILFFILEIGKDPLKNSYVYLNLDKGSKGEVIFLDNENTICEEFYSEASLILKCIAIRTVTWNNNYAEEDKLYLDLYDNESKKLLNSYAVKLRDLPNNGLYMLYVDEDLLDNTWYTLYFRTNLKNDLDLKFAIMVGAADDNHKSHLYSDDEKDLCIVLYTEESY